jgi:hypothetical protein
MSLYALIIETLASSIRCNDNIRGIHIPNTHKNTKLFQHADDCSIISTDISEYDDLIKEFKNFGQVSGSRINEQKTEILKIGNPDTLIICMCFADGGTILATYKILLNI